MARLRDIREVICAHLYLWGEGGYHMVIAGHTILEVVGTHGDT